jgi:hypothetical protein
LRRVKSVSDPGNPIKGDGNDYERGRAWVFEPFYWDIYQHADPRVYLQYGNEENQAHDGDFYRGLMDGLKAIGRRAVIFNDSVGATELTYDVDGKPRSGMWERRRAALEQAKRDGHLVGMHSYGVIDAHFHPVSAFDDFGAFKWYGGRVFELYSIMPPSAQPDLVITECGPGKSEWQRQMGIDACWKDMVEFNKIALRYPYLKAFNWWNIGARNPAFGFPGDWIDDFLPELVQRQRALVSV